MVFPQVLQQFKSAAKLGMQRIGCIAVTSCPALAFQYLAKAALYST